MKNVLVTGGAGFIGTNLCKKLLDLNYRVFAVDNFITSTGDNIKELSKNPNFIFIKHDINKPLPDLLSYYTPSIARNLRSFYLNAQRLTKQAYSGAVYGQKFGLSSYPTAFTPQKLPDSPVFDEIYHLACPTGVPNVEILAKEMLMTCSIGTTNILELAKKHNAKVLFTSTSEAYGDPKVFPQTEMYTGNVDPVGVRSPYEEGKRFSESLCVTYSRKNKLDVKIVRIFNTYGPHMSLKDYRVIPAMINQIKTDKPLTVQGDGEQNRTFCYVDDMVNGFLTVMEKGKSGEVYNLGSDKQITIKDLAKLIKKVSKKKSQITFIPRPSHDHSGRLPSLQKAKALGWDQNIGLEEGLSKTLKWFNVI